jgi:hypothetical protein
LIGANEDISLTIQLRLPGVFELLLFRGHGEAASMEKEPTTNSRCRKQYQTQCCEAFCGLAS